MTKKQSRATKQANSQRAAERAAAIRREQEGKERRRRALWVSLAVLGVVAAIVAIAVGVQANRDTTGAAGSTPSGVVDGYAIPLGPTDAKVKVTVYEDFMCPYCGMFESLSRDTLKQYADSGDVQVRYHIVSFLDDSSSTAYSTRAANAFGVVADESGPKVATKFHDLLYDNQPQEGSAGLPDSQLVDYAVQAGADKSAVAGPIESLKYKQWVVNSTGEWSNRGFTGTPTVTVDGKQLKFASAQDLNDKLKQAIDSELNS